MRNVTEIQRELIRLTFLPEIDPDTGDPSDDGKFGQATLDALNRYLRSQGKAPFVGVPTLVQVNDVLWPKKETPMADSVNVDTQNPLASTSTWAILISILTTIAPFIGLHVPADFSDTILHAIAAGTALYALIRKMFFTKTVSTLVANKL